jgi:hypothetical protein
MPSPMIPSAACSSWEFSWSSSAGRWPCSACAPARSRPAACSRRSAAKGSLVLNNLFLTTAAATVLVGTLYPLLLEAVTGTKISVGPPFFNAHIRPADGAAAAGGAIRAACWPGNGPISPVPRSGSILPPADRCWSGSGWSSFRPARRCLRARGAQGRHWQGRGGVSPGAGSLAAALGLRHRALPIWVSA